MSKRPVPRYDFKDFGAAIKAARTGRRESRKKVCDEMFISPHYLANIKNVTALRFVSAGILFSSAVKLCVFQYTFPVFQTYGVGDFPQTAVVGDMVFKLPARLKRYGVYDKMIMDIICIKVCGNNNFIPASPHPPCGF